MIQPIQIRFRDIRPDPHIATLIHRFAHRLDRIYRRITSGQVSMARPHRHHATGNHYHGRLEIDVPGTTLVAARAPAVHALRRAPDAITPHKQAEIAAERKILRLALRDAFDALARQLREHARRRRGTVRRRLPREATAGGAGASLRPSA